jgi:short-subunit dehydrogenase
MDTKVVVITGASARGTRNGSAFARRGVSVGLLARGRAGLKGALDDVQELGARGITISADVADADAVEQAAEEIERTLGPIDVWGFCDSLRSELLHDGSSVRVTMVQLPAMNTPQFDWVKSRLPRRAQPVPPIYEPEVAADALVWASEHARRELYVGLPTEVAIVGNKVAPGAGDWYLARNGFDSQQTQEPEDPDRPFNLLTPVDESKDFGAHGRFGARAHRRSWQTWLSEHRASVAAGCVLAAAGTALLSR